MEKGPHVVKLHFNNNAPGSARHQVDVHKVELGKRGDADAKLTIKNDSKCAVRVCFTKDLFAGLRREPDPGTNGTYFFVDVDAGKDVTLQTTAKTAVTAESKDGGDAYEFRFRGIDCKFPSVGDLHRSLRSKGIDPGDDPRVVIGG